MVAVSERAEAKLVLPIIFRRILVFIRCLSFRDLSLLNFYEGSWRAHLSRHKSHFAHFVRAAFWFMARTTVEDVSSK